MYGGSSEEVEKEAPEKKRKLADNLGEDRVGKYVVVYRRAGHGTLHMLGDGSCWMARRRTFQKSEVHEQLPEPGQYSVRCKLRWGKLGEPLSESTSDSNDDLDLSD